ncbi:MAG: amidase [Chloroflexota bacterium]|nr:MAG: amidase [Chloroflexota bacterium]
MIDEVRARLARRGIAPPEERLTRIAAEVAAIHDGVARAGALLEPSDSPWTPPREENAPAAAPTGTARPDRAARAVDSSEIAWLSAAELGRRIRDGAVSPVEVVRSLLARIDALDGALNCYVAIDGDRALEAAETSERELSAGNWRGPLHGVPMALKDIYDTAGMATCVGSDFLRHRVPDRDAFSVTRLRQAGAILLGKLNMHEFAYGLTSDNPHFGPTRNPWDRERVPGGSSGGSAAALAAGLCHISLGTDTGASIRLPAAVCGVVGFKPTFGRVSRTGVFPLSWSLDHVGPMARSVEDAALVYDAIVSHDPNDPWCARASVAPTVPHLQAGIAGCRVGVPRRHFYERLAPDVERVTDAALDVLRSLGATIVEVDCSIAADIVPIVLAIIGAEASDVHAEWLAAHPERYGADVRHRLETGAALDALDYARAQRLHRRVAQRIVAAMADVDVMVTPTVPRTAPRFGEVISREPTVAWNRLVSPFNVSGQPALSLPCGFGDDGTPLGLQIVGRPFDEATVLRVGAAYERATERHRHRPALA